MTKHQEVYYTCNGCGKRLDEAGFTDVVVNNTDPDANVPEKDYQLCALCWLEVRKVLERVADAAKEEADRQARRTTLDYDPWND